MKKKIIFLDIDGVILPSSHQKRFKHFYPEVNDAPALFTELSQKYGVDYHQYDDYAYAVGVAASYDDWEKSAIAEVKRIIAATGAKIVLSSDWRTYRTLEYLKDLFRIHDLADELIDFTPHENIDKLENEIGYKVWEYR
ncbi:MAG: hypothetical protein LBT24_05660, partial [Tannerella sp.]|nr:hypothetical protein [Tannerella sp.]